MPVSIDSANSSLDNLLGEPGEEFLLRIRGTNRHGQIVRLAGKKCSIGSGPQCTLRLRAPGVQPLHCLVLRGERATIVRRWTADTRLNGRPFHDAPLSPGDLLGIGPLELEVLDAAALQSAVRTGPPRTAEPARDGQVALFREPQASDPSRDPASPAERKLFGPAALERIQTALEATRDSNRRCLGRLRETRHRLEDLDRSAAERQQALRAFAERLARLEQAPATPATGGAGVQQFALLVDTVQQLSAELTEQRRQRGAHEQQLRAELEAVQQSLLQSQRPTPQPAAPNAVAHSPAAFAPRSEEAAPPSDLPSEIAATATIEPDFAAAPLAAPAAETQLPPEGLAETEAGWAEQERHAFPQAETMELSPAESSDTDGAFSARGGDLPQGDFPAGASNASEWDLEHTPATVDEANRETAKDVWESTEAGEIGANASTQSEDDENLPPTVAEVLARFGRKPEPATDGFSHSALSGTAGVPSWDRGPDAADLGVAVEPPHPFRNNAATEDAGQEPPATHSDFDAPAWSAGDASGEPGGFDALPTGEEFPPSVTTAGEFAGDPEPTDATAASAAPEVETLDWEQRRALLLAEDEQRRNQEDVELRNRELELLQQRHQEAKLEPTAPADEPRPADDEEESIEAYMARLLKRVGGDGDRRDEPTRTAAIERPAPSDQPVAESPQPETPAEPEVTPFADASEFVPRTQAPERADSLEAMRALANSSARSAIESSDKRRGGEVATGKLGIALLGLIGAIVSWQFAGLESLLGLGGIVAGLAVAATWSYLAWMHYQQWRTAQESAVAAGRCQESDAEDASTNPEE